MNYQASSTSMRPMKQEVPDASCSEPCHSRLRALQFCYFLLLSSAHDMGELEASSDVRDDVSAQLLDASCS